MILVAAIALGAMAALAVLRYVRGVEDRVYAEAERVPVYVVTRDIPKGMFGDEALTEGYIRADQTERKFRPSTYVADIESIRDKVALTNLAAGQVVVRGMFVDPSTARVTFAQRIQDTGGPDQVAVTLSFDQVRGVAGLLVPGDRVNILATAVELDEQALAAALAAGKSPADAVAEARARSDALGGETFFLYQNVEVLAVGRDLVPLPGESSSTGGDSPAASGLITFNVPPEAAARLVHAAESGVPLWLTLVPPAYEARPVPPVNAENLAPGVLTPYGDDEGGAQ